MTTIMEGVIFSQTPDKIRPNSKETEVVTLLADIRRESAELKKFTLALSQEGGNLEGNEKLLSEMKKESNGVNVFSQEEAERQLLEHEKSYLEAAKTFQESAPSHSAYLVGYIAKLKQLSERPYQSELEKSKRLTKQKDERDVQLSDLLPHAQILGIARRQVEKETLPPVEVLAKLVVENKSIARDVGLVLNEKDREFFLSLIPEEKRKDIAISMDNELSKVLSQKIIELEADKDQALSVKHRSGQELQGAISNPEEYGPPLVKYLSQSLAGLDSEDSKRLLIEIGKTGLTGEKDKKKQELKISSAARILKTVIDIDAAKGSNLGMKFLAKRKFRTNYSLFSQLD